MPTFPSNQAFAPASPLRAGDDMHKNKEVLHPADNTPEPTEPVPGSNSQTMKQLRRKATIVLLLGLTGCAMAAAQARGAAPTQGPSSGNSAQGQLTVTVTIVASVGLVTGPDGVQRLVVANASDAGDNVSFLKPFGANSGPKPSPKPTGGDKNPRKKTN